MEMNLENTHNEKTKSSKISILSEYDEAFLAHTSEIKRVNEKITADCEKFLQYYEDHSSQMDALSKSLQQREYELKKKESKLQKEKTKLQLKKSVVKRLSSCKQLFNESYISRKLADGLKSELDMLYKRRAELEDQLKVESFKNLESEIMQLETAIQIIQDDDCIDFQEKMKNLQNELNQKNEELQDMKEQANAYKLAIQRNNGELARWELVDGLKTYANYGGGIGTKEMGLVDSNPFFVGCNSDEKRKENTAKYQSLCKHLFEDPDWHPFTTITVGFEKMEMINEEDEKMVILKAECSEEQYRAVVTALIERNRYKQSGRDEMQELWNHKENREASLREGIDYILKNWKNYKHRRR